MFNGIITNLGKVQEIDENKAKLVFNVQNLSEKLSIGDSIAVNGVCLTVIDAKNQKISVDVMPETLKRSNLRMLKNGDLLNIELPIMANSMINGHFVYGHVDTIASLKTVIPDENSYLLFFNIHDRKLLKYMVEKGSVAINGISLTIIEVFDNDFSVGIIPHTWDQTNLSKLKIGDFVNIEIDMMAKHIEKLISYNKQISTINNNNNYS